MFVASTHTYAPRCLGQILPEDLAQVEKDLSGLTLNTVEAARVVFSKDQDELVGFKGEFGSVPIRIFTTAVRGEKPLSVAELFLRAHYAQRDPSRGKIVATFEYVDEKEPYGMVVMTEADYTSCFLLGDKELVRTTSSIVLEELLVATLERADALSFEYIKKHVIDQELYDRVLLRLAERGKNPDSVRWLLAMRKGRKPLDPSEAIELAAAGGHVEIVRLLLPYNGRNCLTGALVEAASKGQLAVVCLLHFPECRELIDSYEALIPAVFSGCQQTVKLLLGSLTPIFWKTRSLQRHKWALKIS